VLQIFQRKILMNKHLLEARDNFIESAGRTTQGFGLGRIIGQLYALLFFSPDSLSLDDMVEELKVSKGSVSTNIRELEKWGAVKKVWIKGSRKDFYEAEVEFMKVIRGGILPFLRRKLSSSLVTVNESKELIIENQEGFSGNDKKIANFYTERLRKIQDAQNKFSLFFKLPGL